MIISPTTKTYALLGHPVQHSLSPCMYNAAFASLDMDAVYMAYDVEPLVLNDVLTSLAHLHFGGVNITVPHKEAAWQRVDQRSDTAELLGAVNTIEFVDGRLIGHNTDGVGLIRSLEEHFGDCIGGKSIYFVGSGGASRAAALMCAKKGAGHIALSDSGSGRAQKLQMEIQRRYPQVTVVCTTSENRIEWARLSDLIIQGSPIGMKTTDASPLPEDAFRSGQCVYDMIYMYPYTECMRAAETRGAVVANGLGMLLHQGVRAFEIFTGKAAPQDVMRDALERKVYGP
ncbi:MAG: shikimate dehydrogenase [Spartobacteria bacterium]|nr:shikimate dehydrogenase [Spartobacteria bacterium]